jgi:hypothetical protein
MKFARMFIFHSYRACAWAPKNRTPSENITNPFEKEMPKKGGRKRREKKENGGRIKGGQRRPESKEKEIEEN